MNDDFPTPLMDLTRVKEFATEAAQLRELLESFERSLVQEMTALKTAYAQGDQEQVHASLHVLKGFMPMFSAPEFAQAMTDLYQQSRHEGLAPSHKTYTRLTPSLGLLLTEVRAQLGHL